MSAPIKPQPRRSIHGNGSPKKSEEKLFKKKYRNTCDDEIAGNNDDCNTDDDGQYTDPEDLQSLSTKRSKSSLKVNDIKTSHKRTEKTQSLLTIFRLDKEKLLSLVFISFILFSILYFDMSNSKDERVAKVCKFDELRQRYSHHRAQLWNVLSVGIEMVLNKETATPGVYLFVHQDDNTVKALIHDIALNSAKCFGHTSQPVHLDNVDFTSPNAIKDYGYVIEQYKSKLKESNVIVIANLNEIPAEVARALHTICDTHSPIAENVVIYLALTVKNHTSDNPIEVAIDTLTQLWGEKLTKNELDPLITRITDQVIALQS